MILHYRNTQERETHLTDLYNSLSSGTQKAQIARQVSRLVGHEVLTSDLTSEALVA